MERFIEIFVHVFVIIWFIPLTMVMLIGTYYISAFFIEFIKEKFLNKHSNV